MRRSDAGLYQACPAPRLSVVESCSSAHMESTEKSIKVWDPVVRIGHWILVSTFFTAYFTGDELLAPHVWAGYILGAVVCFRLVWGFVGPRHARFTDFVRSPAAALGYVTDLLRSRSQRYLGHNPAGGTMIPVLLMLLAGTAISGIVLLGMDEGAGPLATWVVKNDGNNDLWEEIHEVLANMTLLIVGLHIAGVILSSWAHRENLVKAMITGRKRTNGG